MANKVMFFIFSTLRLLIYSAYAQDFSTDPKEVSEGEKNHIYSFLYSVLCDDKETVAKQILYPVRFEFPISRQIQNEEEFIAEYDKLFPLEVKEKLSSKFDLCKNPMVIDGDGVFIEGVLVASFRSEEIKYYYIYTPKDELDKQKRNYALNFHSSISSNLSHPIGFIKTNKYQVLVDYNPSTKTYRYSCWKIECSTTSKPDLIIRNGKGRVYKGGRTPHEKYVFKNGEYTYTLDLNLFASYLSVSKSGREILLQEIEEQEGFKMSKYCQIM